MSNSNPANPSTPEVGARKRIPMSIPTRRLEVPELPNFHLHWFLEKNIARAMQAGYELVKEDEIPVTQRGVGTDTQISGNADLGTNVRVVAGRGEDGQPQYLVLMKIREDWWREDQRILEERNANVLGAIFRGETILGSEQTKAEDRGKSYVDMDKTSLKTKPLFQRPTRKGR